MRKPRSSSRWGKILNAAGFGRRQKRSRLLTVKGRSLLVEPLEERQMLTVLSWDPNHTGGTALGGTGNWMGANNWWNGSSDVSWTNGNDANFQVTGNGTAGTVTLDSAASATTVTFASGGYTLSGGNALTLTGTGTTITANQSATINAPITLAASQQWTTASGMTITVGGNVDLGSYQLTQAGSGSTGISGVVSDTGSLAASGGTLSLTGANTYTGGTTINSGAVSFANGGLSSGNVTIAGNSTLQWASGNTQDISSQLVLDSGVTATVDTQSNNVTFATGFGGNTSAALVKIGTGTLALDGTDTYTGGTTISDGMVSFASGGLGTSGTITVGNAALQWATGNTDDISSRLVLGDAVTATLDVGSNTVTLATGIADNNGSSLVKAGTGTLIVTGDCTYSGSTTIDAGIVQVGNGGATGSLGIGNVSVANGATLIFDLSSSATVSADISGGGSVVQSSTGTLTLSGVNTYTGGTTINAGTVSFASGSLGTGPVTIAGSSTLQWATGNTQDISSRLALDSGVTATLDTQSNNVTLATGLGNTSAAVVKNGTGTLTFSAANSYSGGTTINAGTVSFVSGGLGTTGTIALDSATLQWNGTNTQDISSRLVLGSAATGTLDVGSNTITLATGIADDNGSSLVKAGTGTLILTGSNTYSGTTTVSAGTLQVGSGGTIGSLGTGNVSTAGGATLVFDRTDNITVSNAISGSGAVTQSGSGTLTLTGDNSYSGTTTISAGILQVGAGGTTGTLGSGSVSLGLFKTLIFDRSDSITVGSAISGYGALTQAGTGTLILTGSNSYGLATTVSAGTLQVGNGGNSGALGTGSVSLASGTTLVFDRTGSLSLSNVISGAGSVVQIGTGTLTLTGANTYTGGTAINAGMVSFANGSLGNSGAITIAGTSTLQWNGSNAQDISSRLVLSNGVTLTLDTQGNSVVFASGFGGNTSAALVKNGTGTLTLNGSDTYTGGTTINAGAVSFASGGLGATGNITLAGTSTLQWASGNTLDISSRLLLNNGITATLNTNGNSVNFATSIGSTTAAIVKTGGGTLSFSSANSYTGGTTINGGTLSFVSGGLGASGTITLNGATLQWAPGNAQDISSRLTLGNVVASGLDVGSNTVTLATALTGGIFSSLTKAGSGTLILTGNASYLGTIAVNAGTLQLGTGGTTGMFGSNSVSIASNTTLVFDRSDSPSVSNVISGAGLLVQSGTGALILSGANTYTGGTTINAGTVSFDYGSLGPSGAITFAGTSTLQWNGSNAQDISSRLVLTNGVTAMLNVGGNNVTFASGFGGNTTAALVKNGTGMLTFSGADTYGGGTTINAGGISFVSGGLGSGSIILAGSSTLQWATGNTQDISSQLVLDNGITATLNTNGNNVTFATGLATTTAAIVKAGAGTLTFGSANSYTGGTTINAGTLSFVSGGLGASGTITLNGATLQWAPGNAQDISSRLALGGGVTSTLDVGGNTVTLATALTGGIFSSQVKAGSGTLILTGNCNLGNVSVNAGTLQLGTGGTSGGLGLGNVSIASGATLVFDRSDNISVGNVISGAGLLVQSGTGALILSGANTYTGGTTINAGTVSFDYGSLGPSGAITFAGSGDLQWNGNNGQDLSSRLVLTNGVTDTLDTEGNNVAFASSFGGNTSAALVKNGTGMLTFSGADTYSGGTTINAGGISFVSGGLGTGSIILAGSSTLQWAVGNTQDISSQLLLDNGITATLDTQGNNVTFATGIGSTTAAIVKNGTGTLTFASANSYSGGTTINAGTLSFVSGGLGASGTVTLNGATLQWAPGNAQDISSRLALGGEVTSTLDVGGNTVTLATALTGGIFSSQVKAGNGTLILTGNCNLGNVSVNAGSLQLGTGSTSGGLGLGNVTIASGATLVFDRSDNISVGNVISGAGLLVQSGTGALTLTGANTYTGGTTINAGTVSFDYGSLGPSGAITFAGSGDLQWNGNNGQDLSSRLVLTNGVTATLDTEGNTVTFASSFGGNTTAALVKNGTGMLTFSGADTYSGGTTINAGGISFVSGGLGTGSITLAGSSTLQWAGGNSLDISSRLVLDNGVTATLDTQGNNVTFATGLAATTAAIVKNGTGTLTFASANSYTGGTTINAGTLSFVSGGLGASGTITLNGATLQWAPGNTDDISSRLALGGGVTSTLDVGGNTVTLATALTGGLFSSQVKAGSGTLILTGNCNLGNVSVNAGTLQLGTGGTSGGLGLGDVTIAGGATLVFDRSDNISVGNVISGAGLLVQSGTGALILSGANTYTGGTTINAGTVSFDYGSLGPSGAITFAGSGDLQWNGNNGQDLSSRLVLTNGVTATLDTESNNVVFASSFGGNTSAALVKNGTGMLTFSGADTYSGGTTINAGGISFVSGGLGAGPITLAGSSTLQWAVGNTQDISSQQLALENGATATLDTQGNNVTLASSFVGNSSAALVKIGSGTLTLGGNNAFTGGTTITAGTVSFANGGLGTSGTIALGNVTLQWAPGNTQDVSSRLSLGVFDTATLDTGGNIVTFASGITGDISSLVKAGSGTLAIGGNNTGILGTTVNAGTLQVGAGGTTGSLGQYGVSVASGATLAFNFSSPTTFSNVISGAGGVAQNGSGTLTLAAKTNSYSGGTTINAGALGPASMIGSGPLVDDSGAACGWFRITNITYSGNGAVLQPSSPAPDGYGNVPAFTENNDWVFMGSYQQLINNEVSGLVTDGSISSPHLDPVYTIYHVVNNQSGLDVWTFNPNVYPPSGNSVPNTIYTYIINLGDGGPGSAGGGDPIEYATGAVEYKATDLTSNALGATFSQGRSWTNYTVWSSTQNNGNGWIDSALPTVYQVSGDSTVNIVFSDTNIVQFELSGGVYVPTTYVSDTLVHDTTNHRFTLSDSSGNQYTFYDFDSSIPTNLQGQFISLTDAEGLLSAVTARNANGEVETITRYDASGQPAETWQYSYVSGSDPNAGLLASVALQQSNGSGGWTTAEQVNYTYYDGTYTGDDTYGNLGDLKTATVTDANGAILNIEYYRYYTPSDSASGYKHGLKYVFDTQSYANLLNSLGASSLTSTAAFSATDAQVAQYAKLYYQYDADRRVTLQTVQGVGGSATNGLGTFTFAYSVNPAYEVGTNNWQFKTIETTPDGSTNVVYCNTYGEVILKVTYTDPSLTDEATAKYYQYNTAGNRTLAADALAIAGYTIDGSNNLDVTLNTNSGLITLTDYYSSTTATGATAGGVAGFVEDTKYEQGSAGTPILQESKDYYDQTNSGGSTNVVLADDTLYRNTDGTGTETTSYSYTWDGGSVGVQSMTKALPAVSDEPNGAGSNDATTVVYDAYGRPVWTRDANGYISYTQYDNATGAVVKSITDVNTADSGDFSGLPAGWATIAGAGLELITTQKVDALGRVVEETDPDGNVTYTVYDDADFEVRTYAGWNATTQNVTGGIKVEREDLFGNYVETLTYVWNDPNGLAGYLNADGSPNGTEPLTDARAVLQTLSRTLMNSAEQVASTFDYFNLSGLAYSTARSLGGKNVNYYETDYAYGTWGDLASVTDPLGNTTQYTYDALGNVASTTDAMNNTTTNAYDLDGRLVSTTDALSHSTTYGYNVLGERTGVTDALNETTAYAYDNAGNLVSTTDPLNHTATNSYDARNRLMSTTDGNNHTTTYTFDPDGNVVVTTDPLGHTTSSTYNALGEVLTSTDANSDVTRYTYDSDGNLLTLTDPDGNTTTYAYDALGRKTSETTAAGTRSYEYNAAGQVVQYTDRDGRVTTYAYDALGRDVCENWLDSDHNIVATTTYSYDGDGDMLTASDASATDTYTYDPLGRVSSVTEVLADLSPAVVLSYQYDSVGDCTEVSETIGGTADAETDYSFNALGRVTSIEQHGVTGGDAVAEKRIDFAYDADGQYATVTRYADLAGTELVATGTYTFDDAYQLVGLTYTKGTTTLASYNYTFDAAGNMTSMTTVDGTTNYTSDATGQLTAAGSDTYAYDSNGNRTTANGSTYVTGVNNELMDDGTYTYTYDSEGNRLTKTDKATSAETDYTWDYRDRLSSVTFKDSNGNVTETVYYQYDAFNHLVGETISVPGQAAQQTVWVYDRGQIVSQFDGTGTLTANNLSHRYLWDPQAVDQLFADEQLSPLPPGEGQGYDLTTPGNVLWALTDHENSVRDLATYDPGTDVTTIANHRVYDAYGNLTSQTNAAVDCLFGYTGRQFDNATGLQNNLNRWYDPTVGRWLSEDPLGFGGGDSNLYRYVGNGPTNSADPSGLAQVDEGNGKAPLNAGAITWPDSNATQRNIANREFDWPLEFVRYVSLLVMRGLSLVVPPFARPCANEWGTRDINDTLDAAEQSIHEQNERDFPRPGSPPWKHWPVRQGPMPPQLNKEKVPTRVTV